VSSVHLAAGFITAACPRRWAAGANKLKADATWAREPTRRRLLSDVQYSIGTPSNPERRLRSDWPPAGMRGWVISSAVRYHDSGRSPPRPPAGRFCPRICTPSCWSGAVNTSLSLSTASARGRAHLWGPPEGVEQYTFIRHFDRWYARDHVPLELHPVRDSGVFFNFWPEGLAPGARVSRAVIGVV